ncbi:MAG: glycosyltransferase family 2 protein, partial [Chthoniobacterales bacterium]
MSDPQVSVVMACYNAGKYLAEAIQSVLDQTYRNLELVVVDSGSSDDSWQVVQSFAGDERVRPLKLERHAGLNAAATRNYGLKAVRGEYVKFVDADDILHHEMLQKQVQRMLGRDDCVASSEWGRFYSDDLSTYKASRQSVWRDMDAREWLVESWMEARPMTQCGMFLIPRVLLEKTGGWEERLTLIDDFEFFARVLSAASEVLYAPGCPLYYRSGVAGSLSGSKSDKAIESAYLSASLGEDHLLSKRADARAKRACANIMQDFVYTFYPARPDLRAKAEQRVRELGGADIE